MDSLQTYRFWGKSGPFLNHEKAVFKAKSWLFVGEYGRNLGSLSMTQKQDGRWELTSYELIPVSEEVKPDRATQEQIDALMDTVDKNYLADFGYTREEVLAENDVEFNRLEEMGTMHEELNLGDIISDAYIYAVENSEYYDGDPVDVAVVPSGTVRDTYTKGDITVEDVFKIGRASCRERV